MMSDCTLQRTVVVTDPVGVHLRTATAVFEVVSKSRSRVFLWKEAHHRVEGNDVLAMLALGAPCGSVIHLEATGPDAQSVLDALEPSFASVEGEGEKSGKGARGTRRRRDGK
jgi:phosphotransferase system HPr (HPr) family protein